MVATVPILGTVINMNDVHDKKSGPVAISSILGVGLVFEDGALGWKPVPADDVTIPAAEIYWNPTVLDNSLNASLANSVTGTFYGEASRVIAQADDAIVVDRYVQAGAPIQTIREWIEPTDEATLITNLPLKIGLYKGHANEVNRVDVLATDAVNGETDCIMEIRRG